MQRNYLIIGIIAFLAVVVGGYVLTAPRNACEELAKNLDEKIVDTDNPPGRFVIGGFEGIIGGTITNISGPIPSAGYDAYTIKFKGKNKTGDLFLMTSPGNILPYKVGAFYEFDLKNKNQYSMELSGMFMDQELNALEQLKECDQAAKPG